MSDLSSGPIDYTSRDFISIRDDLIAAAANSLPDWDSTNPNDFLRVLLESFAFVGDLTNFYVDRVANEANLSTATQRQSLFNIARTFGYAPSGPVAASVLLTMNNSGPDDVVVPAGTQFSGTFNNGGLPAVVTFESNAEVNVSSGFYPTQVRATEGRTQLGSGARQTNQDPIGVLLYRSDGRATSDGSPGQVFVLPAKPIIEESVQVWIHPSPGTDETLADGVRFTQVTNLIDSRPSDFVFAVVRGIDDSGRVLFGDSVSGYVPPAGYQVRAVYRVGGGASGNVPPGTIDVIGATPTQVVLPATLSVQQLTAAIGGLDTESDDSIRRNAPRVVSARDRAISLTDFESIAMRKAGVARSKAIGAAMSNVVVYVSPQITTADINPGYQTIEIQVTTMSVTSDIVSLNLVDSHNLPYGSTFVLSGVPEPYNGVWTVETGSTGSLLNFALNWPDDSLFSPSGSAKITAVGAKTEPFAGLCDNALDALRKAAPAGTSVSVAGPVYVDLSIIVRLQLQPNVRQSVTRDSVVEALVARFSPMSTPFADVVHDYDVSAAIMSSVSGIRYVTVLSFARGSEYSLNKDIDLNGNLSNAPSYLNQGIIEGEPFQIFRLLPQNLAIALEGGVPDLI